MLFRGKWESQHELSYSTLSQVETPAILHLLLILLQLFQQESGFSVVWEEGKALLCHSSAGHTCYLLCCSGWPAGQPQPHPFFLVLIQVSLHVLDAFVFLCTPPSIAFLFSWVYVVKCVCTVES